MSVGNAFVGAMLELAYRLLDFYMYAVLISALLSWLLAFGIINPYNRFVNAIHDILMRITEPVLRPIRRYLPVVGGLDLSPLALLFGIYFVQSFLRRLVF
jgi:YggT family protein